MTAEFAIIKRTELANVVVVTAKRTAPNLIPPFTTFTIAGERLRHTHNRLRHRNRRADAHHRLVVQAYTRANSSAPVTAEMNLNPNQEAAARR